jgi:hypothetical protein
MSERDSTSRPWVYGPLATPEATANEPAAFPATTTEAPIETGFADWRRRLTGNLSRRSDGRWAPLTWTHADEDGLAQAFR